MISQVRRGQWFHWAQWFQWVRRGLYIALICGMLPALANQASPSQQGRVQQGVNQHSLDGLTFVGRIRATGLLGLFSVRGTLSFSQGMLFWEAKGDTDSAPYEVELIDGMLYFRARAPAQDGTYVDWQGRYDGERLSDVIAIWTRVEEDDFIHDLLLPDVVTLNFTVDGHYRCG